VLVVSKLHSENMLSTPDPIVGHAFTVAKRFAALCKEKLHATGVSVVTNIGKDAGQAVPHFHIHVIPKYPAARRELRYTSRSEITPDEVTELSKLLSTHQ
jgi:histidine triad (HIT) family protein